MLRPVVIKDCPVTRATIAERINALNVRDVSIAVINNDEIEWAKARFVGPAHYEAEAAAAGRKPALPLAVMASLYERYEEEKRRRGVVDFDDLLLLCARALDTDETFAAAQRWRFRHLFGDEFQDVNPVQFRLLDGWRGSRADLCVVGDANQAIFGWNGADAGILLGFRRHHPSAVVVRLDDNFRSTPQILAAASAVLEERRPDRTSLRPTRGDGAAPVVRAYDTDEHYYRPLLDPARETWGERTRPPIPPPCFGVDLESEIAVW